MGPKRRPHIMRRLMLALLAAASGSSLAQGPPDAVFSGDLAYMLMPPEAISQGGAGPFFWSDDGEYLLYTRVDAPSASDLFDSLRGAPPPLLTAYVISWNFKTKKSQVLHKMTVPPAGLGPFLLAQWLKGTHTAVFAAPFVDTSGATPIQRTNIVRANADTGQVQILATSTTDSGSSLYVSSSPVGPLAVLVYQEQTPQGTEMSISFVRPQGPLTPTQKIAPGHYLIGRWDKSGRALASYMQVDTDARRAKERFSAYSPDAAVAILEKEPEVFEPVAPDLPVSLDTQTQTLSARGVTKAIQSLWMIGKGKSKREAAIVAGDTTVGFLSPKMDAVAYLVQGVLTVRTIAKLPRAQVEQAIEAAERAVSLSKGKQAGLALLMFAADNDDNVPGAGENITEILNPYIKNKEVLDGFTYTFKGGSLNEIKDPAKTELGYVTGPGGRAIVYADGHVVWKKD